MVRMEEKETAGPALERLRGEERGGQSDSDLPVGPKQDLAGTESGTGKGRTIVRYNFAGAQQLWVWRLEVQFRRPISAWLARGVGAMW